MGPMLSARLQTIYNFLLPGTEVWDVCCDHGYLGQAALQAKTFSHVHFVDRVSNIMDRLRSEILEPECTNFYAIDARALQEKLYGTVSIAGVGGNQISKIIESWQQQNILHAQRVILAPQSHLGLVKNCLASADYQPHSQTMVQERGRIRHILVYDRSRPYSVNDENTAGGR